jgi:hypothetical protein
MWHLDSQAYLMEAANSGQRKNEHIFHPTHLPCNQPSYACFPPPAPVISFIVSSCRLQTTLRPLILTLTKGRRAMLVGWMSRGQLKFHHPRSMVPGPSARQSTDMDVAVLSFVLSASALMPIQRHLTHGFVNTFPSSSIVLIIFFFLSYVVCLLLPAQWKCRSHYAQSCHTYQIRRLLGKRDRPVAETSIWKLTGFERAIPASERQQVHALDRAVRGIDCNHYQYMNSIIVFIPERTN